MMRVAAIFLVLVPRRQFEGVLVLALAKRGASVLVRENADSTTWIDVRARGRSDQCFQGKHF